MERARWRAANRPMPAPRGESSSRTNGSNFVHGIVVVGGIFALFYGENRDMVYGDAQAALTKMIEAVRGLGLKVAA